MILQAATHSVCSRGAAPRTPRTGRRAGVLGDPFWVACVFVFCDKTKNVGLKPREVAHLFSRRISRRMPSESCLGTPWGPSYEHICKNVYFKRDRFG